MYFNIYNFSTKLYLISFFVVIFIINLNKITVLPRKIFNIVQNIAVINGILS